MSTCKLCLNTAYNDYNKHILYHTAAAANQTIVATHSAHSLGGAVDVTIVLNLLLFVAVLDWGLEGTALAINLIPSFLRFVGSCLIVLRYEECRRCWPGWTVEVFQGWMEYSKLGLPSLLMIVAETFSWELVTLAAGMCDTADGGQTYKSEQLLAAQAILQSIILMSYCIPFGIKDGSQILCCM